MARAWFRFEGCLLDHLPEDSELTKEFSTPGSIKDAIESLGVPHTEVGTIRVNGAPVGFDYQVQDGDRIHISDNTALPDPAGIRFVLDVHLGRLAAYMRMLGFDAFYRNCLADPEIASISASESRVLLTRDRGLLMRNIVRYGYWLRNTDSRLQTAEVIRRFGLAGYLRPWTRCMACNGILRTADKSDVWTRIPPAVAGLHHEFSECTGCGRVYWKGTHYMRMQHWLSQLRIAKRI